MSCEQRTSKRPIGLVCSRGTCRIREPQIWPYILQMAVSKSVSHVERHIFGNSAFGKLTSLIAFDGLFKFYIVAVAAGAG